MVGVTFRVGEMADTGLVKLAKYIEKSMMQNMVGQHAVWAFTDQSTFEDLKTYGADSISIIHTKELLDAVNISTVLNKKDTVELVNNNDVSTIAVNKILVYGASLLILALCITSVTLFVKRKNASKDNVA
jgi:hypothetical protein